MQLDTRSRTGIAEALTTALKEKHGTTDDSFRDEARQLGLTLKRDNDVRVSEHCVCAARR